jgi:hypothetical protein
VLHQPIAAGCESHFQIVEIDCPPHLRKTPDERLTPGLRVEKVLQKTVFRFTPRLMILMDFCIVLFNPIKSL